MSIVPRGLLLSAFLLSAACSQEPDKNAEESAMLTAESAVRFASLALDCVHREYPNKLGQVLKDESGLLPPSVLHPAFYGCFDWHSSVHGHWMLTRLLKEFPGLAVRQDVIAALARSLTENNIAGEVIYFETASPSWERTYGWAWLLQLAAELRTWDDPLGKEWGDNLEPLTQAIRARYIEFLPRQEYPVRTGVHPNTAFGLSFALDYADLVDDRPLRDSIVSAANRYYSGDNNCPISWEPSGEDFLSPCLEEAALMARVMPADQFLPWLRAFLPSLFDNGSIEPANVSDRSDPKIVHLDGLNLSRAWSLYVVASRMNDDERTAGLRELAGRHLDATLPHITSEHYEGSHWLGSFAIYALTRDR